jgi:hypothetical protein
MMIVKGGMTMDAATLLLLATLAAGDVPAKDTTPPANAQATARSVPREQRAPVVYELASGGIVFKIVVAGRDSWAILDTGATHSVIDIASARAAGLNIGPEGNPVQTPNGEVPVRMVMNVPVLIPGQFEFQHPQLAGIDLTATSAIYGRKIEFILGQDFLRSSVLVVDPSKSTLQFAPSGAFRPPPGAVPIDLQNGEPELEVAIGNQKVLVKIDFGFNRQLALSTKAWELVMPKGTPTGSVLSTGVEGKTYARKTAFLPEIQLGSLRIADVTIDEAPMLSSGEGLLGLGVLGKFRLALDIKVGKIWLGAAPPPSTAR